MSLSRRTLIAGLASFPLAAKAQQPADFYPIPVELLTALETLQGVITLGNKNADIRFVEFFDYNCGYCRRAVKDIRPMLAAHRDVAIQLVNYAVLGIPSIGATRVALAFSKQKADRYLAFHEALFARKGTVDANLAIDVALKNGANKAQLLRDADSEPITQAILTAVRLGESFGFQATPSYLIGRDGFSGFLDRARKEAAIAAYRRCERAVCT